MVPRPAKAPPPHDFSPRRLGRAAVYEAHEGDSGVHFAGMEVPMDTQLPPPMVLYRLAGAHYVSQALYVAAHLGIADLLAEGPQTPETLVLACSDCGGRLRLIATVH